MKFDPSLAPKKEYELLPAGFYKFKIYKVKEAYTKNGAPKLELMLQILGECGKTGMVFDHITQNNVKRIRNLCEALELEEKFDAGELLESDLVDCMGECKLGVESETISFKAKNKIEFYCKTKILSESMRNDEIDDDLPF